MNLNDCFDLQLFADAGTLVNATDGYVNSYTGEKTDFTDDRTLAPEIKSYYDTKLLENAEPALIYSQLGKHQTVPRGNGNSVEFRRFNTFENAGQLQEGVIPQSQMASVVTVHAPIRQYGTYVSVTDRLSLRSYDDIIYAATEEMGASMARTMETLCRDGLRTGTNVLYCDNVDKTGERLSTPVACSEMHAGGTVNSATAAIGASTGITAAEVDADTLFGKVGQAGTYVFTYFTTGTTWKLSGGAVTLSDYGITVTGTAADGDTVTAVLTSSEAMSRLTPQMVNKAVTILRKNNAPTFDGLYVAVIHPSVAHDMRNCPEWRELFEHADGEKVFRGELGRLFGIRFIESPVAPVLGRTGETAEDDDEYVNAQRGRTYATYVFGRDAFGIIDPEGGGGEMIVHDREEIGGPLNQFSTIGYKFETNGSTILYPERVLRVMSCSGFSATDVVN